MAQSDSPLLVGVDGGGSGCRAAIADASGRVLGRGAGGPANAFTDMDGAAASVRAALDAACAAAGLRRAVAHVGLAGILTPAHAAAMAARLPLPRVAVTEDAPTSVAGALGDRAGVLLAVGTGTMIAAQAADGAQRFVGGWGLQVSDQASGAWLGRALLERVLLAHDGLLAPSDLTRATLADFPDGPAGIVAFAAAARPADYARLAPAVADAAARGDPAGRALMRRGAAYLNRAIACLGLGPDGVLCLTGGLAPRYRALLRPAFRARIRPAEGTALDGALRLAARALAGQDTRHAAP